MKTTVYFDGACWPFNPLGLATYGFVIWQENAGALGIIEQGHGVVGEGPGMTNNVAEYAGLIAGMEKLLEMGITESVVFRGDSQLVKRQMSGEWPIRGLDKPYTRYAKEAERIRQKHFSRAYFQWVPRLQNKEADELSKIALGMSPAKARALWDKRRLWAASDGQAQTARQALKV